MRVPSSLLLGALLSTACTKSGARPDAAGANADNPSLAYVIERDGAISHLLGTCHLPLPLETRVDPALIDGAKVVWIEAAVDGVDPLESLATLWDDELQLSSELDRTTFTALTRRTQAVPASMVDHMQPWAVGLILGMNEMFSPEQLQEVFSGSVLDALDAVVATRARDRQVPVRYLETIDEQLAMLATLETDLTEALFPSEAARNESQEAASATLDLCYRQDLNAVPKELYADTPQNRALLSDRNRRWLTPLVPAFTEGGAFVAVGSLHLAGPQGLLALLRDEGFQVTRLPARQAPQTPPELPVIEREPPVLMPIEVRDAFATNFAPTMCAEEQMPRACFYPEASVCIAEMEHAARLCVDQHFTDLEGLKEGGSNQAFVGCLLSGMIGGGLANGFPDRPACAVIESQVRANLPQTMR